MECLCPSVRSLVSPRRKVWIWYIQAYMPHESSEDSSNQPNGPMGSHRCPPWPLNDDTKILTKTDTETFFRYQNFRNRYRDFFSDTKFSETDTETFFPIPNFPKPIPRLLFRYQIFWNRNRDFFPIPNFPKPKPKPSKNWQKFRNREVSKPKCQSLGATSITDGRPSQLAELSRSEFDPELFSHIGYANFFVTFATKVQYLTFCDKMRQFLIFLQSYWIVTEVITKSKANTLSLPVFACPQFFFLLPRSCETKRVTKAMNCVCFFLDSVKLW